MNRTERIWMYVSQVLVFAVGLFLCLNAGAQTMPSYLSRDPEYWYKQYLTTKADADAEHTINARMARNGEIAISGLQGALKAANDSISHLTEIVAVIAQDRNTMADAKSKTEAELAQCQTNQPKTWAGRQLRGIRNGFAVLGGVVAVGVGVRLLWP